jgi:hypothetical protein
MSNDQKTILAACLLSLFGLFLLWQGITGKIVKSSAGMPVLPRWVYVLGGIGMLLLPGAYLILMLFVVE